MTDTTNQSNSPNVVVKNVFDFESVTLRFIVVVLIILGLMIPLFLVKTIGWDREQFSQAASREIGASWGQSQQLTGPMVIVELTESQTVQSGQTSSITLQDKTIAHLPASMSVTHETTHEIRNRGIYRVPVFSADTTITAEFIPVDIDSESQFVRNVMIAIGLSDLRGIKSVSMDWNGISLENQYSSTVSRIGNSIVVNVSSAMVEAGGTLNLRLSFRGTRRFSVVPVGDLSQINMKSDWPHPSFDGSFLPDTRMVSTAGSSASWTINSLSRGFESKIVLKQSGKYSIDSPNPSQSTVDYDQTNYHGSQVFTSVNVGYSVINLSTPYRDIDRSSTYGILFVVLTIVSILCLELVTKTRFHIVQYGIVGVGLVLFFLMLLSLTEHIGFLYGYVLAALTLATMNTTYMWFITRHPGVTTTVGTFLVVLYLALYFVLQQHEFALLIGTVLLLLLLGALMFATRKLHWKNE